LQKKNNYCIVTFDNDFIDISVLKGFPPKIIWLRTGNTSTNFIAEKIIENKNLIHDFIQNSEHGYLEIK
jgi:predicted nuclease of predicted toxin-antitoxin system